MESQNEHEDSVRHGLSARQNKLLSPALILAATVSFLIALFWDRPVWLFCLVAAVIFIFTLSFFFPKPAFFAFIILRTSVDFLTGAVVFNIGHLEVNFTSFVGLAVITFAAISFWRYKIYKIRIPLLGAWSVFLLIAAFLSIFSISLSASLVEIFRWLSFLALFILGFALFHEGREQTNLIKALIASALIPTAVAWFQLIQGGGIFDGTRWRVNGTFVHPNMLAFYLVFVIVLSVFIFLTLRKTTVVKYFHLALILPLFVALIFSFTRGAWVCLFIALLLIGLARYRTFLIASLLALAIFYVLFSPFQERVNSILSFSASDSTVWRLDLWRDAYGYFQSRPLTGYGPGTAPIVIGENRSPLLGSSEPHNDYIKVALETGIFGLIAYLFLIISLFKDLWRGYEQERSPRRRLLFMFIGFFAIAFYLMSAGDNLLKDSSLQWSFWALCGALMYSLAQSEKHRGRT